MGGNFVRPRICLSEGEQRGGWGSVLPIPLSKGSIAEAEDMEWGQLRTVGSREC